MKWSRLAVNLPTVIGVAMDAVERFKGAKGGAAKEAAVIETVRKSIDLAELVSGEDLVNDPVLEELLKNYISTRVALQNFLTAKGKV